jgi:L-idonate 5-dehydrogenase
METAIHINAPNQLPKDRGPAQIDHGLPVAKELELIATFLSHEEFRWAVDMLVQGRIDIGPILTGEFLLADAISGLNWRPIAARL